MGGSDVQAIIEQVEQLLSEEELSEQVEAAIQRLLDVVEALSAEKKSLANEAKRLRQQLDQKKKAKTTNNRDKEDQANNQDSNSDYSSEKWRRKLRKKKLQKAKDRRSFKDLTIHDTVKCPAVPAILSPEAVRLDDEIVIVQVVETKPKNTKFLRQVCYSATQQQYYRGPLPAGYDHGDFSANLRSLIVALKYCGNMSEPKIDEFLENFAVQVSAGSISNILTNSASDFEQDSHDVLLAGLSSTTYQQTGDTSARVKGEFWHTHILCNPFYTLYSTQPHKDRLALLGLLQNTDELQFRWGQETIQLLQTKLSIPKRWQQTITGLGEVEFAASEFKTLLDDWFDERNQQLRTAIAQASAIVSYRHQISVPVVRTLICDDVGQFKLLTDKLARGWIHAGRHYENISLVVGRRADAWDAFQERFWNYYGSLQAYRARPTEELATKLRLEFDKLFSTRTGYENLDPYFPDDSVRFGMRFAPTP